MKKTINIYLTLFAAVIMMAATNGKGASEIYEMIKAKSGDSFSMSVNKDFKELFDMDMDLNGSEKWVKGDFERGKFLVVDKEEVASLDILEAFEDRGYFMTKIEDEDEDKTDGEELYVFTDEKGKDLHEVHFYLLGEEKVILMSIYGNIQLEKK